MIKYIDHYRNDFYTRSTLGYIHIDDKHFCYTLEDTLRAFGIKVYGETGIPANSIRGYKVKIHKSNRFKRDVIMLYTESNGKTLKYSGISFDFCYAHGGNKHQDTEGCVLVAYNKHGNTIQGTAEKALVELVKGWIDGGHEVIWRTYNKI